MKTLFLFLKNKLKHSLIGCGSVKKGTQEKQDFNMEKFFTEEQRVQENRQRLRELYEQHKKLENHYPIYLAYFAAVGLFMYDLLAYMWVNNTNSLFTVFTMITLGSIIYVGWLIWGASKKGGWYQDYSPQGVYEDYIDDVKKLYPHLQVGSTEFKNKILIEYRCDLEKFVKANTKVYVDRSKKISKLWFPLILSLVLLSINVTSYKILTMDSKLITEKPEEVIPDETILLKNEQLTIQPIDEKIRSGGKYIYERSRLENKFNQERSVQLIKKGLIENKPEIKESVDIKQQ